MRPSGGAVQQMQPPMHADIAAGVDGSVTIGEGNRWPLAGGVAARLHPAETYAFLIQLQVGMHMHMVHQGTF